MNEDKALGHRRRAADFSPTLTVVFEPAAEGGFTCFFEELPEVFSEGETLDEARENLRDALELVLAYRRAEARQREEGRIGLVRETYTLLPVGEPVWSGLIWNVI